LAGENFGDSVQIRQNFIRQLLVASEKSYGLGLKSPKFSLPNAI